MPFIKTVALIVITFYLSYGYGFGSVAMVLFFIWLMVTLFQAAFRRHSDKKIQRIFLIKLILWIILWLALYTIHRQRIQTMRQQANQIVQQIEQYHTQHGAYPPHEAISQPPRMYYWRNDTPPNQGEATLGYADPIMLFDKNQYDFKSKKWSYQPD
ncbi:hypothetical protein [Simonsiella muelleri]|uniref:hypothetical protein n=1 Tax=Simonsiella muelleri TaxID=72 RepID=UPI0023F39CD9|nr:hypothetical protein [Simonsiella muelleri]